MDDDNDDDGVPTAGVPGQITEMPQAFIEQ